MKSPQFPRSERGKWENEMENGVVSKGRVAQTVLDWVTHRNDRVVRPKQGLQRDEPRDATPEAGFLLTL
jgi:hypothetical protein